MMKAYLVDVSLRTRIVLPDDFNLEDYWEGKGVSRVVSAAEPRFIEKLRTDMAENITEIEEDCEVPYDPEHDGSRFCESCTSRTVYTDVDGKVIRYCREYQEPLDGSMWQGCPKHNPMEKEN